MVLGACDTTDVLHDIYLSAHKRIERGGAINNPDPYFRRAIWINLRSNTAPYRYADKKWERCKLVIDEEVNDERWDKIEEAMQGLDDLDRLTLELKYIYGDSNTELCNVMGAHPQTLNAILTRAIEDLKKMV